MKKVWFFSECTVYNGKSAVEFNKVRTALEQNKIAYKYKTVDLGHNSYKGSGGVTRSVGGNFSNADSSLVYEVLVNKKDYDAAMCAITRKS